MRDYVGPELPGLAAEPMFVGAERSGIETLREAVQDARDGLRSKVNATRIWDDRTMWMGFALLLQTLDEGSLGVSDYIR